MSQPFQQIFTPPIPDQSSAERQIFNFMNKINQWLKIEAQNNPSNLLNVQNATRSINECYLKKQEVLTLTNFQLSTLPPEIKTMVNLKKIYLDNNLFEKIPLEIFGLINLELLVLSSNRLSELSPQISQLTRLKELYLEKNLLRNLPVHEIKKLRNLRQLSISQNFIEEKPKLDRKIRLYCDGNPFLKKTFLTKLIEQSQFNSEEMQTAFGIVLGYSKPQNYLSSLGKFYIYNDEKLESRFEVLTKFYKELEPFDTSPKASELVPEFISLFNYLEETFWWDKNTEHDKINLSRELITITSEIFDRRDNIDFLIKIEQIVLNNLKKAPEILTDIDCRTEYENGNVLVILFLKNLCSLKNLADLSQMTKESERQIFAQESALDPRESQSRELDRRESQSREDYLRDVRPRANSQPYLYSSASLYATPAESPSFLRISTPLRSSAPSPAPLPAQSPAPSPLPISSNSKSLQSSSLTPSRQ
jgi:Leucine-rich repeat (LRR) protein